MNSIPQVYTPGTGVSEEAVLEHAVYIIQEGGVVVCATDTGYLLGVNGLNPKAIRTIYRIKGRSFDKPIHLVVADVEMAKTLAEIDADAERIFQEFLPGPLTLVLRKKSIVPEILVGGLPSIGVRIPQNAFLLRLVRMSGLPLTATSANRSGRGTPYTVEQVFAELGEAAQDVDMMIDQGETRHAAPSTILDLTRTPAKILRQGPITAEMLHQHKIL